MFSIALFFIQSATAYETSGRPVSANMEKGTEPLFGGLTITEIANASNELYDNQSSLLFGSARKVFDQCFHSDKDHDQLLNALDVSYRNNLYSNVYYYMKHTDIFYDPPQGLTNMSCTELNTYKVTLNNINWTGIGDSQRLDGITNSVRGFIYKDCSPPFQPNVNKMLMTFARYSFAISSMLHHYNVKLIGKTLQIDGLLMKKNCSPVPAPPDALTGVPVAE